MNGLYLVRPSQLEVDANAGLVANQPGASAWSWDGLFSAMKKVYVFLSICHTHCRAHYYRFCHKSETFTPPSSQVQAEGAIEYSLSSHGTSGPLHYSYPGL